MANSAKSTESKEPKDKSDDPKMTRGPTKKTLSSSKSTSATSPDQSDLILKALSEIRDAQTQSDKKMDTLTKRMDNVEQSLQESYEAGYEDDSYSYMSENKHYSDGEIDDEQHKKSESDRFSSLSKRFRSSENCGPDIDSSLARNITDLFSKGIEEGQYEDLVKDENLPRPNNCTGLQTVRMNRIIWDIMSRKAQSTDAKLQKCATSVIKSSVILATTINKLVDVEKALKADENTHSGEISSFIDNLNDAVALLGHANYQNCMLRRDLLKPELKKEFSVLCNHNVPYTAWLFGDDVSKTVKEIEDSSRMGSKVLWTNKRTTSMPLRGRFRGSYRHRPYGNPSYCSHYTPSHTVTSDERKNSQRRGGAKYARQ